MPKVKSYSAAWLSENAPGHQLFEPLTDTLRSRALSPTKKKTPPGPRRTIARRGTEVFVAVGKEIRWGNLVYLKEGWMEKQSKNGSEARAKREDSAQSPSTDLELNFPHGMRTIKTPVADDIRQLIISPNSNYLAILTTHTAHICALPDSSHLTSEDTSPLKPKMWTLGPTTHVTSRSSIASAVWHPLGVNGSCLVTVTSDAVVRVWELSTQDRWSFDSPTSSIDLRKLADGTALEQDFSASVSTTNKGFSPDEFEMEVAAASFGSKSSGGWNPMTLWIAMREGDVYALCPLLPQRWAPPPTLIPSLSVSIATNVGSIEDDPMVEDCDKLLAQQQLQWMGEIEAQGPQIMDPAVPGDQPVEVFTRPSKPGAVPRLQGPFDLQFDPETGDELDTSITDILIIGKKSEADDAMLGEEDDVVEFEDGDQQGLSLAVVCLLSTSGQIRIYLDTDGVQGQWLPPKSKSRSSRCLAELDPPTLVAFQAMDTMTVVEVTEDSWPVFSKDVMSRYSFFVTHHAAIHFISLASWVFRLESELSGEFEAGTDFRLGLLVNSQSVREKLYAQPAADASSPLAAAAAFRDPDLGYFLLSATPYGPVALTFDTPDEDASPARPESPSLREQDVSMAPLDFHEPRPVYQPPHVFSESSAVPELIEKLRTSRHKTMVTAEVKLSPLTLQIFTDAHKVLSDETHRLGVAAAEVFRRCEMLQAELQQQVRTVNEVRGKIDAINGAHRDVQEPDNAMYERRIGAARERQERLAGRLDNLRKMVGKAAVRELSAKERAFVEEVKAMEASVLGPAAEGEQPAAVAAAAAAGRNQAKQLWKRLEEVRRVQAELLAEAEALRRPARTEGSATPELRIPQDVRRSKMQQVQGLLSRESALVDAVTSRLERLQASL
ncbi:Nucleoporin nup82 [Escovopsis weberi]|uniref:Nucleoporin nup82 n=1 Tax=Escovopsis weberi TaxID=150374 RepID=A0A0M9VTG5_ESCWE|nr:Nucleoporin nup82 [Escovopsis weberi]